MTTFVAIDFETGDARPDSACAVGLVRVEAGADAEACARVLLALRAVEPALPVVPVKYVRGACEAGEALPPADAAYWYVGADPGTRADLPPKWRMLRGGPSEPPPLWATLWCVEGLAAWVSLPPPVAVPGDPESPDERREATPAPTLFATT